eukprot:13106054-Alexandrium_andersonii.AAC.1
MDPAITAMSLRGRGPRTRGRGRGDLERPRATRGRATSTEAELADTGDPGGGRPTGVGGTDVPCSEPELSPPVPSELLLG